MPTLQPRKRVPLLAHSNAYACIYTGCVQGECRGYREASLRVEVCKPFEAPRGSLEGGARGELEVLPLLGAVGPLCRLFQPQGPTWDTRVARGNASEGCVLRVHHVSVGDFVKR